MTICKCGKETSNPKYCSQSCSARYNNVKRAGTLKKYKEKTCLYCNKGLPYRQSEGKYCNNTCKSNFEYNNFISGWIAGTIKVTGESRYIKRYFTDLYNNRCEKCNWGEVNPTTGLVPLHIHHINGDSEDNTVENLQLLCPNCHSLTDNYGIRNKGKGRRKYRELYWKEKNTHPSPSG